MPAPAVAPSSPSALQDFELGLLRDASSKFQQALSKQWAQLEVSLLESLTLELAEVLLTKKAELVRDVSHVAGAPVDVAPPPADNAAGRNPGADELGFRSLDGPVGYSGISPAAQRSGGDGAAGPEVEAQVRTPQEFGPPAQQSGDPAALPQRDLRRYNSIDHPETIDEWSDDDLCSNIVSEERSRGFKSHGVFSVISQRSNATLPRTSLCHMESDFAWNAKKNTKLKLRSTADQPNNDFGAMPTFTLHPMWRRTTWPNMHLQSGESMRWWNNVSDWSNHDSDSMIVSDSVVMPNWGVFKAMMVDPCSPRRWLWVCVGLLMICWDVIILPPQLAGLLPEPPWFRIVEWVIFGFWVLDIFVSLRTGYYEDGVVELRPRKVAARYLRGWFAIDALIVLIDCVLLVSTVELKDTAQEASESSVTFVRLGRTLRALRMLRLVRLLRLGKLMTAFSSFLDRLTSEFALMLLKVGRLVVFIMVLNHYIACGWLAIAFTMPEDSAAWIEGVGEDRLYLYLCAYHWAVTQFTPATQDLRPTNVRERGFATGVVLVALLTFSSFLGKMTSAMTQLLNINAAKTQEETKLRRFFHDYHITPQLRKQIWQCYRKQSEKLVKRLRISDVDYFSLMPERLQTQLRMQLYVQNLKTVPIVPHSLLQNSVEAAAVCKLAVSEQVGGPLQEIFTAGATAVQALSVCHGSLLYQSHMLKDTVSIPVGDWVCEGALWGSMKHQGLLRSCVASHWMAINAHEFRVVMRRVGSDISLRVLQLYATKFAAHAANATILDVLFDDMAREQLAAMAQSSVFAETHAGGASARRSTRNMIRFVGRNNSAD